ncbi:MAG TPA: carbohydrate kinase family protein [Steroidobacteraceae bacterium]|nr:carbohydrate kinase family protein [Steroidobacteraceae bacterium]
MSALICGSIAYDNIMVFPGRFKDHILADKIHMLNVSFLVPTLRRNFGGCAANIAYNLKLLGGKGAPMATVGHDIEAYRERMLKQGIALTYVKQVDAEFTAQCFITTDLDNNQITAFHPGAMNQSHIQKIPTNAGIKLGLISPDGRDGMIQHAEQFAAAAIPFIFDPGQGLPMFEGKDLLTFIDQATYVAANDYEGQLISERTGLSHEAIAQRVKALIITRGGDGSTIFADGKRIDVPCAKARVVKDPTGCGDAYRAGLIYGIEKGMDWETIGRVASLIGTLKIESDGPQNHTFTMAEFATRFNEAFGRTL